MLGSICLEFLLLGGVLGVGELLQQTRRGPLAVDGQHQVVGQAKSELHSLIAHPEVPHLPLAGQPGKDGLQDVLAGSAFGLCTGNDGLQASYGVGCLALQVLPGVGISPQLRQTLLDVGHCQADGLQLGQLLGQDSGLHLLARAAQLEDLQPQQQQDRRQKHNHQDDQDQQQRIQRTPPFPRQAGEADLNDPPSAARRAWSKK
jgi:hypothetical protein